MPFPLFFVCLQLSTVDRGTFVVDVDVDATVDLDVFAFFTRVCLQDLAQGYDVLTDRLTPKDPQATEEQTGDWGMGALGSILSQMDSEHLPVAFARRVCFQTPPSPVDHGREDQQAEKGALWSRGSLKRACSF